MSRTPSHSGKGRQEPSEVRMPLQQITCGGDGDDDAGAGVIADAAADQLSHRLGGRASELGEQLAPPAQQRAQQPRDGQHDVAVGDFREHLLARWVNQIEIYFSIVQRKVLTPNDFNSLTALENRLLAFQDHYQAAAKPFQWRFTRQDLDSLLQKLATRPKAA